MNIVRILFLQVFVFAASTCRAQEDPIDTDRPDQTESVNNTPKKYLQFEFGFGKLNVGENNYTVAHPDFLFKYGLSKRVELRLEGTYESSYYHLIPNPQTITHLDPVELGTRIFLFEQKGLRPKTAVLVHFGLPFTASFNTGNQNIFPSIRMSFQNSLTDKIALGYNVGVFWDGFTNTPFWQYTFSSGFDIGKRGYAYAETFGYCRAGVRTEMLIDAGIAYNTSDNTKIDFSAGKGVSNSALKNYVAIGFSFRIRTGKRATSSTH